MSRKQRTSFPPSVTGSISVQFSEISLLFFKGQTSELLVEAGEQEQERRGSSFWSDFHMNTLFDTLYLTGGENVNPFSFQASIHMIEWMRTREKSCICIAWIT